MFLGVFELRKTGDDVVLANLLIVSKLRWDNLLCHSQDLVPVAFVIRQIGDVEAIWLMSIAYKFVPRLPVKRSSPTKFLIKTVFLLNATSKSASQTAQLKTSCVPTLRRSKLE